MKTAIPFKLYNKHKTDAFSHDLMILGYDKQTGFIQGFDNSLIFD